MSIVMLTNTKREKFSLLLSLKIAKIVSGFQN